MDTIDLDRLIVLSSRLVRTRLGAGEYGVAHATLKTQCEVNEAAWALLDQFTAPLSVRAALEHIPSTDHEDVLAALAIFLSSGFLVPAPEEAYLFEHGLEHRDPALLVPVSPGFLDADSQVEAADFCFVGVPFDRGSDNTGAARAPRAIREASARLGAADPRSGRLRGVRDGADGRLLLEGARLVDRGDIALFEGDGHAACYERIRAAAREVAASERGVLVFVGGDHAITPPIVDALATEALFVVHFDAHTDASPTMRGIPHDHGNCMDTLRRNPRVAGVLQIGMRDLVPAWRRPPAGITQIGCREATRMTPADLVAHLPPHLPCYVTIDIDVLDPADAPGTWTPVPAGLPCALLEGMLEAIGAARNVRAMDLVELAPALDRQGVTVCSALRILLRFLAAVQDRREGASRQRESVIA